jgi:hypothetical protein
MSPVVSGTDAQRNSQSLPARAVGLDITDATCFSPTFPTGVQILELQSEKANQIKWVMNSECV